jgi:hypothetical protein
VRIARRAWRLSTREVRWLLAALAGLPAAAVTLHFRGLRSCLALSERVASRGASVCALAPDDAMLEAMAIARIVRLAATYGPYRATCLPRAVVLWTLLCRRGLNARIRIGVRRPGERLDAHAWVQVDDQPVEPGTNSNETTYVPLRGRSVFLEAVE